MTRNDRVDRYVAWFRNHRVFSVLIAAGILLGLIGPLAIAATGAWSVLFGPRRASLQLVEARVVDDPWEAGRLLSGALPELADSAEWATYQRLDSSTVAGQHGRIAGTRDSALVVWFPNFAQFPDLALIDVLVRNTAPQAALISKLEVRADKIGVGGRVFACLPLGMSAAYHVRLESQRERQVVSQALAHRIAGNDAERLGLLIGHDQRAGAIYRVNVTLLYNGGHRLALPAIELTLGSGCGGLGPRLNAPVDMER